MERRDLRPIGLDALRQKSKRISFRTRSNSSTDNYRYSALRSHHHIRSRPDLRQIFLESIRASAAYLVCRHVACCSRWYLLLWTRVPGISTRFVHRLEWDLNWNGHGGSVPTLDQHSKRVLHSHNNSCRDMSMELCKQRFNIHHGFVRMVCVSFWNDRNSDRRLLPSSKTPTSSRRHVSRKQSVSVLVHCGF